MLGTVVVLLGPLLRFPPPPLLPSFPSRPSPRLFSLLFVLSPLFFLSEMKMHKNSECYTTPQQVSKGICHRQMCCEEVRQF